MKNLKENSAGKQASNVHPQPEDPPRAASVKIMVNKGGLVVPSGFSIIAIYVQGGGINPPGPSYLGYAGYTFNLTWSGASPGDYTFGYNTAFFASCDGEWAFYIIPGVEIPSTGSTNSIPAILTCTNVNPTPVPVTLTWEEIERVPSK